MSIQIIPVEPFDYVVFGGSGDLAELKLLPALYHRQIEGGFVLEQRHGFQQAARQVDRA
ncbi:hypothetical protein ACC687_41290, partial [Rhizobium ruizarguesonis]